MRRWFASNRIGAFAIAETPNPHFHAALTIAHGLVLDAELRKAMEKWWNDVLHRPPTPNALDWRQREEPTEAIAKYLSKSRKGGRGVKGKASWLTFQPYFKTRLPCVEKQTTTITQTEARAVLGPFRLTYGASRKLIELRAASSSSKPRNPVVNTTFVSAATHTPDRPHFPSQKSTGISLRHRLHLQPQMTPATFKAKWGKFTGKESAAYQEHFNDLCRVLGVPTPIEADPTGEDSFCFQKHVVKDAELFAIGDDGKIAETADSERGFADVWKSECFAWEYKGPKEDLEKAYKQLLRYRESLLNPPLLIVCDFNRYIVRTNFNGAVQDTHTFKNADIDSPEAIRILRAALTNPDELRPKQTTAEVTEKLAKQIAEIALRCMSARPWNSRTRKPANSITSRSGKICALPVF